MNDDKNLSALLGAGQTHVSLEHARDAILIEDKDLPWVTLPDGSSVKVFMVDFNHNIWIIKNRFKPGFAVDTHYHTGTVYAFTEQGEWYYKEYPHLINKAGSFLFEPAHAVHTLMVDPACTEDAIVSFTITGSNINVDEQGNVISILDAQKVYRIFKELCAAQGFNCDKVIVHD